MYCYRKCNSYAPFFRELQKNGFMKKQEIDQERGSHGDRHLRGALPQSRGQGEFCDDGEGRGWRDIGLSSRHALGWTTARKRNGETSFYVWKHTERGV